MVLPLVVLVILFVLDVSRVMLVRSVVDDAVYRSAHVAALRGDALQNLSGTPWAKQAVINSLEGADIPDETRQLAIDGLTIRSNCTRPGAYVELRTTYGVRTFTPGLASMMSWLTQGSTTPHMWMSGSAARVRCEVVPG